MTGQTTLDILVAGVRVRIHPLFGGVARLCAGYALPAGIPGEPDLELAMDEADLIRERELSTEGEWSDAYLETLAIYRRIAEWGPAHGILLMHGAVIEYAGAAYMFCAASGTGKSTHIGLWHRYLGDAVQVVNGDKPLVSFPEGAAPLAHGTPWCGKEGWQRDVARPLAGICFLERAEGPGRSSIRPLDPLLALDRVMRQVYLPQDTGAGAATLELVDRLLATVPAHLLRASMAEDAVRTSFEGLTGLPYPAARA